MRQFKIKPSISKGASSRQFPKAGFFLPVFAEPANLWSLLASTNVVAVVFYLAGLRSWNEASLAGLAEHVFFANWMAVCGALVTDQMRPFLVRLDRQLAVGVCLLGLEAVVVVLMLLYHGLLHVALLQPWQWSTVADAVIRGALLVLLGGGLVLYYLYTQERVLQAHQAELTSRVHALQARIRPHFLFNSMNSLAALIGVDDRRAEQMVHNLSALFRASLGAQGEIPLQDEIELCKQYLALEKVRLGERLQVDWQLPDEDTLYDLMIPALTLQPLLENAVLHGVESRSEISVVQVVVETLGNRVQIVMTNPLQAGKKNRMGNQMALQNIQERLRAYYGNSARLHTHMAETQFTVVLNYQQNDSPWPIQPAC